MNQTALPLTLLAGAAAAAVGTVVKTKAEGVLQPWAEKLLPPSPADKRGLGADPGGHPENMPPSEVADRVQHTVTGGELSDEQRQQVAGPLHWGMGLGAGVAYAVLARRYPVVRAGHGAAFGAVLFAATHGSTLPAAGLQEPPTRLPKAWWIWEGGSHVTYGVAVDLVLRTVEAGLARVRR
ncbi:DUF1440 domain-containing protein [Jatrophihabitans sp. YIM 134969]